MVEKIIASEIHNIALPSQGQGMNETGNSGNKVPETQQGSKSEKSHDGGVS
jgi:hypothetical protein